MTIPSDLLRPFGRLRRAAQRGSTGEVRRLLSRRTITAQIAEVAERLRSSLRAEWPGEFGGGLIAHRPGQTTVTEQPNNDRRIGLHLDNWYNFPMDRRELSPNRICINLGAQDRFFLLINVPIAELYRRIRDRLPDHIGSRSRGTLIAREFLKFHPSYPIVRLRIRPGEAYIAPTDNIVHDGSTLGMTVPDVSLSLRGWLPLIFAHRGK